MNRTQKVFLGVTGGIFGLVALSSMVPQPEVKIVKVAGPERVVTETVEVADPDVLAENGDLSAKVERLEGKLEAAKARPELKPVPLPSCDGGQVTFAMEQAYASAQSYLESSDFSLASLIGQLEYEEFSKCEATYGATKAYK